MPVSRLMMVIKVVSGLHPIICPYCNRKVDKVMIELKHINYCDNQEAAKSGAKLPETSGHQAVSGNVSTRGVTKVRPATPLRKSLNQFSAERIYGKYPKRMR